MIKQIISFLVVAAVILSILYKNQVSKDDFRHLWSSWKAQYGVSYDTITEDEFRFSVFISNYLLVQEHNSRGETYFLVLNQFSNLTNEEFAMARTSANRYRDYNAYDSYCPSASPDCPSIPIQDAKSKNWTAEGAVTPVKDQGNCGSCWAFSATGTLEGLYFLNHWKLLSFSEQQLLDCDEKCDACDGCYAPWGMAFAAKNGIEQEADYPYIAKKGTCTFNESLAIKANTGHQCLPQRSEEQLRSAVLKQPVSVSVEARSVIWQNYGGGVVSNNCGNELDHDVLLVGYDVIEGKDAWIVKNSWGSSWGVNGYIFISRDSTQDNGEGVCGILRCCNIPINNV